MTIRRRALLGWGLAGFTLWLTIQLFVTYRDLRANGMLVPRLGPGLFLALAGSLVAGATAALCSEPESSGRPRRPPNPESTPASS